MNQARKPVWAGRNMRLDPFRLPQAVTYATRDADGDVSFTIDERGAVIKRVLPQQPSADVHRPAAKGVQGRDGAGD